MSNTITTTDLAARTAAAAFHAKGMLVNTVNRDWEPEFKQSSYEPGTSIRIRRPARFSVVDGAVASPEDITEDTVTLTVAQRNVSARWTTIEKQLKLNPSKLADRVFKPMANRLVRKVETYIAQTMALGALLDAGNTPGVVPGAYSVMSDGMARIMEQLPPDMDNIYGAFTPSAQSKLLNNVKQLANPSSEISNVFTKGRLKNIAGVNFFPTQSIYRLANGTGVNSDTSLSVALIAGTTQTMTSVGASKTFLAGQAFTIPDVFAVDPETGTALPSLKVFRLSADATSSGGGALTVVLTESVVLTGNNKNVSSAGAGSGAVVWYNGSASGALSYQNLIYHKDAFAFVALPMALPEQDGLASNKTVEGITIKAEIVRDGTNDQEFMRMDALFGGVLVRPEWVAVAWGE